MIEVNIVRLAKTHWFMTAAELELSPSLQDRWSNYIRSQGFMMKRISGGMPK